MPVSVFLPESADPSRGEYFTDSIRPRTLLVRTCSMLLKRVPVPTKTCLMSFQKRPSMMTAISFSPLAVKQGLIPEFFSACVMAVIFTTYLLSVLVWFIYQHLFLFVPLGSIAYLSPKVK